jgi:hypothetical protein
MLKKNESLFSVQFLHLKFWDKKNIILFQSGQTALHMASKNGNTEIVRLLLIDQVIWHISVCRYIGQVIWHTSVWYNIYIYTFDIALMRQPCVSKRRTISVLPFFEAMCNAVWPLWNKIMFFLSQNFKCMPYHLTYISTYRNMPYHLIYISTYRNMPYHLIYISTYRNMPYHLISVCRYIDQVIWHISVCRYIGQVIWHISVCRYIGQVIWHISVCRFILQWQHLPTNIACPIIFLILVSYK